MFVVFIMCVAISIIIGLIDLKRLIDQDAYFASIPIGDLEFHKLRKILWLYKGWIISRRNISLEMIWTKQNWKPLRMKPTCRIIWRKRWNKPSMKILPRTTIISMDWYLHFMARWKPVKLPRRQAWWDAMQKAM